MSERFDDVAVTLASENPVGRRSMVRGALAALGLGAGVVVARQQPAAAGKPVSCPPGLTACGSVCRDLSSSNANCGSCGTVCGADAVCRDGTCVKVSCTCAPTCGTGLTWCGACVNTATDAANCGACGTVCQSGQVCSNGACGSGCPSGQTSCNGVCVNTSTNVGNCGTCGTVCPGTDTICQPRTCTNGVCGHANAPVGTTCGPGLSCDGNGACGSGCPSGQTSCNGVCVNTSTNVGNCGFCGNVCPAGPNSFAVCNGAVCGLACSPGFANCDGSAATGCETNVSSDPRNCGACGIVCASGSCTNGVCA